MKYLKYLFGLSLILAIINIAASAQEKRVEVPVSAAATPAIADGLPAVIEAKRIEISASISYTFSSGIEVTPVNLGGGLIIDSVGPKNGFSVGLQGDYSLTENFAVGFLWSHQGSELRSDFLGGGTLDFTDLSVSNYHGVITYHLGDEDARIRPFFFGGIGATRYHPDSIRNFEFDSETRFSTTWGGGIKVFPKPSLGVKLTGRWTPTKISSRPKGIWCSGFYPWSCWVVSNTQHSHQLEFSGGLIFRF